MDCTHSQNRQTGTNPGKLDAVQMESAVQSIDSLHDQRKMRDKVNTACKRMPTNTQISDLDSGCTHKSTSQGYIDLRYVVIDGCCNLFVARWNHMGNTQTRILA